MGQNPPIRPIISLRGITKKTSDTFSNDGIDLDVYKGEIHVLIGESGSGKTTLTDIMCGKLRPDFGAMFIMGKKVEAYSLDVVSKMGIALIPRNPVIIPSFTIMENIILGVSSAKKVFISEMEMLERTEKISSSFGLKVNPAALANKATQGLKMRIEIVKAIYKGARILIFDEPDTVLSPQEAVEMFLMFKTLAIRGRTIIITTDKFNDIIGVADRISVLSKGKVIRTFLSRQADERELAKLMFGANSVIKAGEETSNPKNVILDVFNVQFSEDREISKSGQGITFRVGGGEVLGLLEIDGGGRENLIKVITGYKRAMKGTVKINGVDVTNKTPHQVIRHKVAYFSRDEKKVRAISDFTVTENIVMGIRNKNPFSRGGFIRRKEVARLVSALMGSFKLASADKKVQVKFLSEVERQKVVLASELYTRPEIFIVEHPSRDRDAVVMQLIYKYLDVIRTNGKAVLLISDSVQEALSLCDRIAVMCEGELVDIVDAKKATESDLKLLLAGVKPEFKVQVKEDDLELLLAGIQPDLEGELEIKEGNKG